MYFLEKYNDNQYSYSNDADVNFDADVQKRKESLAQPKPDGLSRNRESMGFSRRKLPKFLFGPSNCANEQYA